MNNATLTYVINYNNQIKRLKLETQSLLYVDRYTSEYKNEDDFIKNYYNKGMIDNFIRENGNIKGKLVVSYTKNMKEKEDVMPLYNSQEEFALVDNPYEGKITEIEKARKLLFNSKNQMFAKLVISNNTFENHLNKMIDLSLEEAIYLKKCGFSPIFINNKNYISFKSLFEYRIKSPKLGCIRGAYQDMLKTLKNELMILDDSTFYFYNRQLRILINKYNELIQEFFIKNLKIKKIKFNKQYVLKRRIT